MDNKVRQIMRQKKELDRRLVEQKGKFIYKKPVEQETNLSLSTQVGNQLLALKMLLQRLAGRESIINLLRDIQEKQWRKMQILHLLLPTLVAPLLNLTQPLPMFLIPLPNLIPQLSTLSQTVPTLLQSLLTLLPQILQQILLTTLLPHLASVLQHINVLYIRKNIHLKLTRVELMPTMHGYVKLHLIKLMIGLV